MGHYPSWDENADIFLESKNPRSLSRLVLMVMDKTGEESVDPELVLDAIKQIRSYLPAGEPDIFAQYSSSETVKEVMQRSGDGRINQNGKIELSGIGYVGATVWRFPELYRQAVELWESR